VQHELTYGITLTSLVKQHAISVKNNWENKTDENSPKTASVATDY